MALFHTPLVLLLLLPLLEPGVSPLLRAAAAASHHYSPCCATGNEASYHSAGRTSTLDLSVHLLTAASEPRASEAETAGSDSGMVIAAPPTAKDLPAAVIVRLHPLPRPVPWTLARDAEQDLRREIRLASLRVEYSSAAPLLAQSPQVARWHERFQRARAVLIARLFDGDYCAPELFANMTVVALDDEARWPEDGTDFFLPSYCCIGFCIRFQRARAVLIARLFDGDYCAPESFANLTVVALDYEDLTVVALDILGRRGSLLHGGQDYVPGHRLCGADPLPPLAEEGNSRVVTHGRGLEEADASGMVIDTIYSQFPLLHGWVDVIDADTNATSGDDAGMGPAIFWAVGLIPAFLIPLGNFFLGRRTFGAHRYVEVDGEMRCCQVCDNCWRRRINWVASCCQLCLCSTCFAFVSLRRHSTDMTERPCQNPGAFGNFGNVFEKNRDFYQSSHIELEAEQIPYKSPDPAAKLKIRVFTKWRSLYARIPPPRVLKLELIEHNGRVRKWRKIDLAPKDYSSSKVPLVMSWKGWD